MKKFLVMNIFVMSVLKSTRYPKRFDCFINNSYYAFSLILNDINFSTNIINEDYFNLLLSYRTVLDKLKKKTF